MRNRPAGDHPGGSEVIAATTTSVTLTTDDLACLGEVSRRIGWQAAMTALRIGGEDAARAARGLWVHPRHAEVEAARQLTHEPCPTRCDRCSRCAHAAVWRARGGRDFLGVNAERAAS